MGVGLQSRTSPVDSKVGRFLLRSCVLQVRSAADTGGLLPFAVAVLYHGVRVACFRERLSVEIQTATAF